MGEIADDMISGLACQWCGAFFVDDGGNLYEHGFPCICNECWKECLESLPPNKRKNAKKSGNHPMVVQTRTL